jgi:hypothetical protein
MAILILLYGGWPLAAYVYWRFQRRRPAAAAFGVALLALAMAFFVGTALGDVAASLGHTQPNTPISPSLVLALSWFLVPYLLVCVWWICRLLRRPS